MEMVEKRFYAYSGNDLFFAPIASRLTPLFINLKIPANVITILSGFVGILGAVFFSSNNKTFILIGSFGYMFYFLLDYIDGNVARLTNKSSISGMFLDIFMGPVVAISMTMSIYIGSLQKLSDFDFSTIFINIIGIIYLSSILILYTRFAFVWLTVGSKIVEDRYQNKIKTDHFNNSVRPKRHQNFFIKAIIYVFHENFMIYSLPILGLINFLWDQDLRLIYPLAGVFILFPACLYEIYSFMKYDKINEIYNVIVSNEEILNPIKTIYLK